jgi:hypothetical protein
VLFQESFFQCVLGFIIIIIFFYNETLSKNNLGNTDLIPLANVTVEINDMKVHLHTRH